MNGKRETVTYIFPRISKFDCDIIKLLKSDHVVESALSGEIILLVDNISC